MNSGPSAPVPALLTPGTGIRDGLDRIVNGHTGALIVLGTNDELEAISTGGFSINVPLTATGLRELAKMDGAIVLSNELDRILAAAVHLSPSADLPTSETGTRHRTAERVARQTRLPVVTVSASMSTISVFAGSGRQVLPRPDQILDRATQAIGALASHRIRLFESLDELTAREVHGNVTLRDLAHVAQRFEMINRVADEAAVLVAGLGADGRIVGLQLRDFTEGLTPLASLLQRDYLPEDSERPLLAGLAGLDDNELFDVVLVGRSLGFDSGVHLDSPLRPKGYRQLATIPRLPAGTSAALIAHFGDLDQLLTARTHELTEVDGVTKDAARLVRDGLAHVAERSLTT
ncbi:DNA integrity scanning diadenylate cyclase DisA [Propioniciclava sp.]|uniref:DNA integrity scanning diadenylate cyclase DisA n=1 Tax=Propioniciclava sp. TaxID=2038686 RepID=UPI00262923D3|nr:DNA integrity scanning diadenylate cyclase DisA [Propioniciclava sp.]